MSLLVCYVICVICISKKLKYLKNEAQGNQKLKDNLLCYFKVLSNKTNLILGFSSPLTKRQLIAVTTAKLAVRSFLLTNLWLLLVCVGGVQISYLSLLG